MTTNRIDHEARNWDKPTPNMLRRITEERKAHEAFMERELAKRFIVRDDFGSSRFSTLEKAQEWAHQNASILSNPVIITK